VSYDPICDDFARSSPQPFSPTSAPMRLHRYFASHADVTLTERRLKLAQISSFNDPFEFVHSFTGDYTVEQAEEDLRHMPESEIRFYRSVLMASGFGPSAVKLESPLRGLAEFFVKIGGMPLIDPCHCQQLADRFFVLCCFSQTDVDPREEILLWSHYARSHSGVRIEFELDEKTLPLQLVDYSHTRCAIDLANFGDPEHTNEILQKTFQTKAMSWSYEHEVRLILKKECAQRHPIPLGYRYYFPFDPSSVRQVDFGINCDIETIATICQILQKDYSHATYRRAVHHKREYSIDFCPLDIS
jgi:hypothetical protein